MKLNLIYLLALAFTFTSHATSIPAPAPYKCDGKNCEFKKDSEYYKEKYLEETKKRHPKNEDVITKIKGPFKRTSELTSTRTFKINSAIINTGNFQEISVKHDVVEETYIIEKHEDRTWSEPFLLTRVEYDFPTIKTYKKEVIVDKKVLLSSSRKVLLTVSLDNQLETEKEKISDFEIRLSFDGKEVRPSFSLGSNFTSTYEIINSEDTTFIDLKIKRDSNSLPRNTVSIKFKEYAHQNNGSIKVTAIDELNEPLDNTQKIIVKGSVMEEYNWLYFFWKAERVIGTFSFEFDPSSNSKSKSQSNEFEIKLDQPLSKGSAIYLKYRIKRIGSDFYSEKYSMSYRESKNIIIFK